MPKVAVYNIAGEQTGELELSAALFDAPVNQAVLHQVVVAQLANKRQGTKSALTRTEVRGGGRKPYRQKGTGRARQGSIRAPQYKKGGVVFAPKPRDFRVTLNKKVKRLAFKGALTAKVAGQAFIVVDTFSLAAPKTKEMAKVLNNLKVEGKALIVTNLPEELVTRSAGNLPGVQVALVNTLNTLDILKADKLVVTKEAVARMEEVYAS